MVTATRSARLELLPDYRYCCLASRSLGRVAVWSGVRECVRPSGGAGPREKDAARPDKSNHACNQTAKPEKTVHLRMLKLAPQYNTRNPFAFMELQDVQELTNFFERRVSAYQVGVQGEICFDAAF